MGMCHQSAFVTESLQMAALATERLAAMGVEVLAVHVGTRKPMITVHEHRVLDNVCSGITHLQPTKEGVRTETRAGVFDHCQVQWETQQQKRVG